MHQSKTNKTKKANTRQADDIKDKIKSIEKKVDKALDKLTNSK